MVLEVFSLFFTGFLAGSVLPLASEAYLVYEVMQHPEKWGWFFLAITVGNTIGGVLTWYLGRLARVQKVKLWLDKPRNSKWYDKASKNGSWVLVLAWVPIVGDVLVFAGGVLKFPLGPSVLWMFVGKALRYAFVVGSALFWVS